MLLAIIKLMILPAKLYKQINEVVTNFQMTIAPLVILTGFFASRLLQVFAVSFSTPCTVELHFASSTPPFTR